MQSGSRTNINATAHTATFSRETAAIQSLYSSDTVVNLHLYTRAIFSSDTILMQMRQSIDANVIHTGQFKFYHFAAMHSHICMQTYVCIIDITTFKQLVSRLNRTFNECDFVSLPEIAVCYSSYGSFVEDIYVPRIKRSFRGSDILRHRLFVMIKQIKWYLVLIFSNMN